MTAMYFSPRHFVPPSQSQHVAERMRDTLNWLKHEMLTPYDLALTIKGDESLLPVSL